MNKCAQTFVRVMLMRPGLLLAALQSAVEMEVLAVMVDPLKGIPKLSYPLPFFLHSLPPLPPHPLRPLFDIAIRDCSALNVKLG